MTQYIVYFEGKTPNSAILVTANDTDHARAYVSNELGLTASFVLERRAEHAITEHMIRNEHIA